MLSNYFRHITILIITLLLTGCGIFSNSTTSNNKTPIGEESWQQHKANITQLTSWQVDGKVGIKTEQSSGSATLFWLQQYGYFDIRLSGPLGLKASRIQGYNGKVTLEVSGQGRYTAATPEELLLQQLGWDLPVSHLAWWIKGLPAPDTPYTTHLNEENRLKLLQQDSWTIEYKNYQQHNGYWLPSKIIATNPTMRVTLVAKQWTLKTQNAHIAKK